MNIRIVSRIDIKSEFVVKGIQMEGLRKLGKPVDFAQKYYNQGADEIIFVDVVASYYDRNHLFNVINDVCKNVFIPITVCGGIRKIDDIEKLLLSGADKIAINTSALMDKSLLKKASEVFGSQSILSSIEAKKVGDIWLAYYNNGRDPSDKNVIDWVREVEDCGVGEILLTSVDNDGTKRGMDTQLIEKVSNVVKVPLIVCGGIGNLNHFKFLESIRGVDAISLASALHYSLLDIKSIKEYVSSFGYEVRK